MCQSKLLKPAPTVLRWAGLTLGGLAATLVMTLSALPVQATKLKKGDIVVADGGANAIIQVDPTTGEQTIASSGGSFVEPLDLRVYRGKAKGRHEGTRQYDSEAGYGN